MKLCVGCMLWRMAGSGPDTPLQCTSLTTMEAVDWVLRTTLQRCTANYGAFPLLLAVLFCQYMP